MNCANGMFQEVCRVVWVMWWIVTFLGTPGKASISLPGKSPSAPPSSSLLSLLLFMAKIFFWPLQISLCLLRWLVGFPARDSQKCIGMLKSPEWPAFGGGHHAWELTYSLMVLV